MLIEYLIIGLFWGTAMLLFEYNPPQWFVKKNWFRKTAFRQNYQRERKKELLNYSLFFLVQTLFWIFWLFVWLLIILAELEEIRKKINRIYYRKKDN